jgi:LTXXQ motif family protein
MSKHIIAVGVAGVIAIAALSVAFPANAQMDRRGDGPGMMHGQGYGPGMMGPGHGPGMMGNYGPGMMGGCPMMGTTADGQVSTFAEGRIAFLKAELGITDAQKSAWDAYAETIRSNLQNMQGMWQTMMTVFEAKTPADRLDAQIAAMDGRLAALKQIEPALAALYVALSAEQKKKADEVLTGMGCMM